MYEAVRTQIWNYKDTFSTYENKINSSERSQIVHFIF